MTIETVVFPVAGKGTRFLPATLGTPKELLPIIDKPLLQFAIDEAIGAGAQHLIFVTSPDKPGIAHYVDCVRPANCRITIIEQKEQLGLGHAVGCAEEAVGDQPFGVILPDDLIDATTPTLLQMSTAAQLSNANIVAIEEVPANKVDQYGIIDPAGAAATGSLLPACGIKEKPSLEAAPSRLAVVGRYVLHPSIFATLRETERGAGGEIQLTDALAADIATRGLSGYRFNGTRYDCGTPKGMLQATLAFATLRDDLWDEEECAA